LDMWTDAAGYLFNADDVTVIPLVMSDSYSLIEESPLIVPAPGVLTNDTEVYGLNLSAFVLSGPSHGDLNLAADGSFTYTPASNYYGSDSFSYQANDSFTNVGSTTVSLVISAVNHPPILPAQGDRTVAELTQLTVTNTATDVDAPPNNLSYI